MIAVLAAVALLQTAPAPTPAAVRCGAVERPGIAVRGPDGAWHGRAVEICAAVAKAASDPTAPVEFHGYVSDLAMAKDDHIAFLSQAEVTAPMLSRVLRPGPVIGYQTHILVVRASSPVRRPEELAGRLVCFMIGSAAEDALDDWALREAVAIERLGFQEPDEMHDAYASGKCSAMAIDTADEGGAMASKPLEDRALGEPLARVPIVAAVPVSANENWASLVARVIARHSDSAESSK